MCLVFIFYTLINEPDTRFDMETRKRTRYTVERIYANVPHIVCLSSNEFPFVAVAIFPSFDSNCMYNARAACNSFLVEPKTRCDVLRLRR